MESLLCLYTEWKLLVDSMSIHSVFVMWNILVHLIVQLCKCHSSTLITSIMIRWAILLHWSCVSGKFNLKWYPKMHSQDKCPGWQWSSRETIMTTEWNASLLIYISMFLLFYFIFYFLFFIFWIKPVLCTYCITRHHTPIFGWWYWVLPLHFEYTFVCRLTMIILKKCYS